MPVDRELLQIIAEARQKKFSSQNFERLRDFTVDGYDPFDYDTTLTEMRVLQKGANLYEAQLVLAACRAGLGQNVDSSSGECFAARLQTMVDFYKVSLEDLPLKPEDYEHFLHESEIFTANQSVQSFMAGEILSTADGRYLLECLNEGQLTIDEIDAPLATIQAFIETFERDCLSGGHFFPHESIVRSVNELAHLWVRGAQQDKIGMPLWLASSRAVLAYRSYGLANFDEVGLSRAHYRAFVRRFGS